MKDLLVNRRIIPDWYPTKSLVMVYPYKLEGRNHLMPFYNKFLTMIPDEIRIILLVNDIAAEREIEHQRIELGILNEIEFMVFPNLFDIWIRDYAPLIIEEGDNHFPVKFNYNPSYVSKKYSKYIQHDNQIGEELGRKLISKNIRTHNLNWDLGNLTHNGEGTAIISNRFIADNLTYDIEKELKTSLLEACGFTKVIFIPTEPDEVTGHVDGMCRFIYNKTLIVGSYPSVAVNSDHTDRIAKNLKEELGEDYEVIRLENAIPEDLENEGIASAVGNHLNFLRLGNKILFPYYGEDISEQSLSIFRAELEKKNLPIKVIPVKIQDLMLLARLGGVLNCITWQIY